MMWLLVLIPALVILPPLAGSLYDIARIGAVAKACELQYRLIKLRIAASAQLADANMSAEDRADLGELIAVTETLIDRTHEVRANARSFRFLRPISWGTPVPPRSVHPVKTSSLWDELEKITGRLAPKPSTAAV